MSRKDKYKEGEIMNPKDNYDRVELPCGCLLACDKECKIDVMNVCREHDPTIFHSDWEE